MGALVALTGCGGSSPGGGAALPTPTASSHRSTPVPHHPHLIGTCHLVSVKAFHDLVDTSRAVPCSARHNVETAGVHPVYSAPSKADLRSTVHGYLGDCDQDYLDYLHLQDYEAIRILVVPLAQKSSDGSWVVRCDLYRQTELRDALPAAVTTTSLGDQASSGQTADWGFCLDGAPDAGAALVDCTRSHAYEGVLTYQTVTALQDVYPTPAQLRARGDAVCRSATEDRPEADQLGVVAHWQPRQVWVNAGRPTNIYGTCYFFRLDHHDLPGEH